MAVYDVQIALKSQGFSASQEDLSKWFSKGGVKAMSPKAIGTMLKIWSRFSQAGQAAVRPVEILDSQFGSRHCMAWTTNLDFICQRTSCRKTSSIQNALLVWCLECLLEDVGCKRFPPDLNQPSLKIVVSRYLLKKRVLTYIARKFPALDEAGRSYDTRFHPSKVLDNVFSTVAAWKESGLSSTLPTNLSWLQLLPEYQQQLLQFGTQLLRGSPDLDRVMDAALDRDALVAAEAGPRGIFHIACLL